MPDAGPSPSHDDLVDDLKELRRKGRSRLRSLHLPTLEQAVRIDDADSADMAIAIDRLVGRAIAGLGDGQLGQAAKSLFGYAERKRGIATGELRRDAAVLYGVTTEAFRHGPETVLIDEIATEILKLIEKKLQRPHRDAHSGVEQDGSRAAKAPESKERPKLQLFVGQELDSSYRILDRDGVRVSEHTDRIAEAIDNQGGVGTVYHALYREIQDRAIKFLTFNQVKDKTGKRTRDLENTFLAEREMLAKLSHGNIARLFDFGTYIEHDTEQRWQYTVTEYVDGTDILSTAAGDTTSPDEVYDLISDVLSAVRYMHSRHVYHCDLKFENIICRGSGGGLQAVVLDLGTSHYLPPDPPSRSGVTEPFDGNDRSSYVRFGSTFRITHERHRQHWNSAMPVERLRSFIHLHEIYTLGILLQELTSDQSIASKLQRLIGNEGIRALRLFIDRLLSDPATPHYTRIDHVYRDWEKLRKGYLAPANVPELSLAAEFKYAMPTSAGRGLITPRLSLLINHKMFQRLRRVPQLELTLLKYSGATHTRLAHSLASLRNSRYYVAHLLNDPIFRLVTERSDIEAIILLALLHDLGHYQLSHMFEDFASDQQNHKSAWPWEGKEFDIPSDDDFFFSVVNPGEEQGLRGKYSEVVREALGRSEDSTGVDPPSRNIEQVIVAEFGADTYDAFCSIHRAVYSSHRPGSSRTPLAHLILGAVISSDIDVDKVSYLKEDAERTGVAYGLGVERDAILGALRAPALDDVENRPTIAITQQGVRPAESIALNRNEMYGSVYWHHTNRAATSMVKYVIARLFENNALHMPTFVRDTLFMEYEVALRYLHQRYQDMVNGELEKPPLRNSRIARRVNSPIGRLIEGERGIYKTAFSTIRMVDREQGTEIAQALTKKTYADTVRHEEDLRKELSGDKTIGPVQPGEILLDIPIKERAKAGGERGGKVLVYRNREDDRGKPLENYTPLLESLKSEHERENLACRIFVAPRLMADDETGDRVMDTIRRFLEEL